MSEGKINNNLRLLPAVRGLACIAVLGQLTACGSATVLPKNINILPSVVGSDNQGTDGSFSPTVTDADSRLEISAKSAFCCNPRTIVFEAVTAKDLQPSAFTFFWDFGDNRTARGPRVEHTYSWAGRYEVELNALHSNGTTITAYKYLEFEDPSFVQDPDGDDDDSHETDDPTDIDEEELTDDDTGIEDHRNTQLRCMVNLTGYALAYPGDQWASAPLITDISIFTDATPNPEHEFSTVINRIKASNPDAQFGTYISGGRVEASLAQYPAEAIRASSVPVAWLLPGTDRVNLANRSIGAGFADLVVSECKDRPGSSIFLDNIVHPSALAGWVRWEDTCWFMARVREGLSQSGKHLIANIAVAPFGMNDTDVVLLSESVDGMAFEMPFHVSARGDKGRTDRLIAVYRAWLDAGKTVVLIPVAPMEARDQEATFIAGFAMLVRNAGDRLHVAWPFFQESPSWTHWPRDFGPAEGSYTYNGNRIIRQFRNVILVVDPVAGTVSVSPR